MLALTSCVSIRRTALHANCCETASCQVRRKERCTIAIPMALLLLFGFNFLTGPSDQKWGEIGITVLAAMLFIASVIVVVYGFLNPDPNSLGVHSLKDKERGINS